MKNIHVLPTDKPSRLHKIGNELGLTDKPNNNFLAKQQNIYITSDEEIKIGDSIFETDTNTINVVGKDYVENELDFKIILTTDPDLIKDGVQAIDDEFLEWFIKNPSCEEVDVNHFGMCCSNQLIAQCINCNQYNPAYKIIIPKEEPKQETLEEASKDYIENTMKFSFNSLDTKTQANRMLKCAEFGAKWQAERMYSEEEVQIILSKLLFDLKHKGISNSVEWFEQFKKK